eukprot:6190751-Pleurochrysis_carterae.AAC.1
MRHKNNASEACKVTDASATASERAHDAHTRPRKHVLARLHLVARAQLNRGRTLLYGVHAQSQALASIKLENHRLCCLTPVHVNAHLCMRMNGCAPI